MDEKVAFNKNGSIRFQLEDGAYLLRLPRLGEYRKLRESLANMYTTNQAAIAESESGVDEEELERVVVWLREAFELLADRPLDSAEDDWPSWMVGGTLSAKMMQHWREVPLDLG